MKNISEALQSHLECELTTLAKLVKIVRLDGVIVAFTTHDADIIYDGVCYSADGSLSCESLYSDVNSKNISSDISGIICSDYIANEDLKAGYYDHAQIDIYVCNWADLSQGTVRLRHGWFGEVSVSGNTYNAEIRGFSDLMQRRIGDTYTPECRHDLGDGKCGINITAYTVDSFVTGLLDSASFTDNNRNEVSGLFDYGKILWTSGANTGLCMEIKKWNVEERILLMWLPMPNDIAIGDAYTISQGCDKRFCTCSSKFNNVANFGGFPHLPGIGKILSYPDNK